MEVININDINEYISFIDDLQGDFYFRGESSLNYKDITASAFREYSIPFTNKKKIIDYTIALSEYYREVGHQLTDIERENFIQYSQHYGIPTPLVDITSSPLTALYFSVSSNYSEDTCKVHVFDRERFIDMSDFNDKNVMRLNNFFLNNDFTREIMKRMADLSEDAFNKIFMQSCDELFKITFKTAAGNKIKEAGTKEEKAMLEIIDDIDIEGISEKDFIENFVKKFESKFEISNKMHRETGKFTITLSLIGNEPTHIFDFNRYFRKTRVIILSYIIDQIFRSLIYNYTNIHSESFGKIARMFFPLISIQPTVKFDRMKSQEGLFIFQLPIYRQNKKGLIGYSEIKGDYVLEINNKEKIFRSLERMGINQMNIFPDHDNIASYLKNKQLFFD